ncbi:class I SAM-dependent methyltransferase [Nocardiopsis composta]
MTASTGTAGIPSDVAAEWVDRWDSQQEGYVPHREERFAVLADVVAAALADVAAPVVVDLGCGPGSLTARLAERLPRASFIGVDADPCSSGWPGRTTARPPPGSRPTWPTRPGSRRCRRPCTRRSPPPHCTGCPGPPSPSCTGPWVRAPPPAGSSPTPTTCRSPTTG